MANPNWSAPFQGFTYLRGKDGVRWVSVQNRYEGRHELTKWFRGCGFSPIESIFETEQAAKEAGESWLGSEG